MKVVQRIAFKVEPTFEANLIVNHQNVCRGDKQKGGERKYLKSKEMSQL